MTTSANQSAARDALQVRAPVVINSPITNLTVRRPIAVMSPLMAAQIAAGEVVDRPSSVVKELVENSIDAGARSIVIDLDQGGIELIRITDDGSGIPESELSLALAAHATSKLSSVEDLARIATMGFRGEALASILSVSRLTIRSRTKQQQGAAEIHGEGDQIRPIAPASGPVGTVVTVRNLFFNTPARRKFLRTPQTEQGRCLDIATDLAMAHPAIGFLVRAEAGGGREPRVLLSVPPDQSPRARAVELLGNELESQLLEATATLEQTGGLLSLWGLVGLPSLARQGSTHLHLFVNGRVVRDKTLQHACREAYRGLIEPGRWPTAVIMIDTDPARVDVNVHPTKAEVRFRDQSAVHQTVYRAVKNALAGADLTAHLGGPGGTGFGRSDPLAALGINNSGGGGHGPAGYGAIGYGSGLLPPRAGYSTASPPLAAGGSRVVSPQAFTDYFKRFVPAAAQARLDGRSDGRPLGSSALEGGTYDVIRAAVEAERAAERAQAALGPPDGSDPSGMAFEAGPAEAAAGGPAGAPLGVDAASPIDGTLMDASPIPPALQVHNSFLLTQDAQGVVIVDQHALHERVMFEKLLARLQLGPLESQALLAPASFAITRAQAEALDALLTDGKLLRSLGIDLSLAGPLMASCHAFTTLLFERGVEPQEFCLALLDKAAEEAFEPSTEEALRDVLDMMACKAAIKAGNRLTDVELAELLALRDTVERSSNCPHGRPTSIRLSIRDLERLFGRG